jgi:hypothetical protein
VRPTATETSMFVLTALVYPGALAALCTGAGLLVDRCSGRFLPAPLVPTVGAAALIAVSQLTTYFAALAPGTPYVMAAAALAGFALERARVLALARRWRTVSWQLCVPVLAYVIVLAPVLFAGRPTLSSYMALADSAFHITGADFLMRHGQEYVHLDLRNSYGLIIDGYYNSNSYPSGADTLLGGTAFLLGLPVIWAFQPFNGFILALASGPAWLLARRMGLRGIWAALAALTATVPALVYGYELIGSIKELVALAMTLTLGGLVAVHRRWLRGPPQRGIPFALVLAAGASALGAGFGAWGLAAAAILLAVVIGQARSQRRRAREAVSLALAGGVVLLLAAWPTWDHLSGSVKVTETIASTSNPGNLQMPLRDAQLFGSWLRESYKTPPIGIYSTITYTLIALTLALCVLGALHLLRTRRFAVVSWVALMLVVLAAVKQYATTWVDAKGLVITSPAVMLAAWAGIAALRSSPRRVLFAAAAPLLALAVAGGVLASDAAQYHGSNLAPTARYEELASINGRFAGRGPALFTDFDEYAMYELRDLDVGGPDFAYPPPALAALSAGHGDPVDLDSAPPAVLRAYPLIVTRRDPASSPPPAAYRLLWQGVYYQVWGRRAGAPAAIVHVAPTGSLALQCTRIQSLAAVARADHAQLLAAPAPELIPILLAASSHPANWGHEREGLVMSHPGRLAATFTLPRAGVWDVWLQGQIMPAVRVGVDGKEPASIAGQLDGNSLVADTMTPIAVRLSAGRHRITVTRGGFTLAPGDGGAAVLDAIFLTPAGAAAREVLSLAPAASARSLCGRPYNWLEIVRS